MGLGHREEPLRTNGPIALRYLMTETLFELGEEQAADPGDPVADVSTVVSAAVEDSESVTSTNKNPELSFLGQNSSGFLFVFQDPVMLGQHRLPAAEMDAFEKILSALKLKLADVALINIAGPQPPTAEQLLAYFQPLKVVLLGTQLTLEERQKIWPELTLHQIYSPKIKSELHASTPQVLHSYSFAEMMDDVAKKRTFWTQLKALIQK